MCIDASSRRPNALLIFGMMAFALANAGGFVLRQKVGLAESVADPLSGFMYGLAIGTTLLGLQREARLRRSKRGMQH